MKYNDTGTRYTLSPFYRYMHLSYSSEFPSLFSTFQICVFQNFDMLILILSTQKRLIMELTSQWLDLVTPLSKFIAQNSSFVLRSLGLFESDN